MADMALHGHATRSAPTLSFTDNTQNLLPKAAISHRNSPGSCIGDKVGDTPIVNHIVSVEALGAVDIALKIFVGFTGMAVV